MYQSTFINFLSSLSICVCANYHGQVLFLDQRGTGLSSPISAATLALQGTAIKQAEYLKKFRADNIVRDCESVRKCLTACYPEYKKTWSLLGQSFGGFCSVTYLSLQYVDNHPSVTWV